MAGTCSPRNSCCKLGPNTNPDEWSLDSTIQPILSASLVWKATLGVVTNPQWQTLVLSISRSSPSHRNLAYMCWLLALTNLAPRTALARRGCSAWLMAAFMKPTPFIIQSKSLRSLIWARADSWLSWLTGVGMVWIHLIPITWSPFLTKSYMLTCVSGNEIALKPTCHWSPGKCKG